jgi:PIN domain nuclease of toxin-antitoxin system
VDALLDTNAFLRWTTSDPLLSRRAYHTIADRANRIFVSAVTSWEIAIKVRIGRLTLAASVDTFVDSQIAANGFERLLIDFEDTYTVSTMPLYHNDPFDRLLISQALLRSIPIVTSDRQFRPYGVTMIW